MMPLFERPFIRQVDWVQHMWIKPDIFLIPGECMGKVGDQTPGFFLFLCCKSMGGQLDLIG
jgi:hypothetical protein